jgi:hypothetical protein
MWCIFQHNLDIPSETDNFTNFLKKALKSLALFVKSASAHWCRNHRDSCIIEATQFSSKFLYLQFVKTNIVEYTSSWESDSYPPRQELEGLYFIRDCTTGPFLEPDESNLHPACFAAFEIICNILSHLHLKSCQGKNEHRFAPTHLISSYLYFHQLSRVFHLLFLISYFGRLLWR